MNIQEFSTGELEGRAVYSGDRLYVGRISAILTDQLGRPQYLEVRTGWLGARRHAIPVAGIRREHDGVVLPYTGQQVREAPTLADDEQLTYEREQMVGEHYGVHVREWDDTRDGWLRWLRREVIAPAARGVSTVHEDIDRHMRSAEAEWGASGSATAASVERLRVRPLR